MRLLVLSKSYLLDDAVEPIIHFVIAEIEQLSGYDTPADSNTAYTFSLHQLTCTDPPRIAFCDTSTIG